jgi:hypothetical protein
MDTYTMYGFSLYKMKTGQTNCIRVRRSSDNTELDIGFEASGWVDRAAILAFVGSGDGFIVTWYDPNNSGATYNATNAVAGQQAYIVFGGVLEITSTNRPIARSRGRSCYYYASAHNTLGNNRSNLTVNIVGKNLVGPVGFLSDRPWPTFARQVIYSDGSNYKQYSAMDNGDLLRTILTMGASNVMNQECSTVGFSGTTSTIYNGVAGANQGFYGSGLTRNVSAAMSIFGGINGQYITAGEFGEMTFYIDSSPYNAAPSSSSNWGIS